MIEKLLEIFAVSIPAHHPVTQILEAATSGDLVAVDRLLEIVYEELRGLATSRLIGMSPGQTLRPTDLVHEAYLKLVNAPDRNWENRRHFINAAGVAMRSVLVDQARARATMKRGGDRVREPLDTNLSSGVEDPHRVLALNESLLSLAIIDDRAARVVNLRVFLGLPESEIATVLGITDRTVQRDWKFAKAWLANALGDDAKSRG